MDDPSVPPGWYGDPTAPGNLRWWDGTTWTEHTHPGSEATPVPPVTTSELTQRQPTSSRSTGRGSGGWADRLRRAPRALLITSLLVTCAAVAAGVLLLTGDDAPETARGETTASGAAHPSGTRTLEDELVGVRMSRAEQEAIRLAFGEEALNEQLRRQEANVAKKTIKYVYDRLEMCGASSADGRISMECARPFLSAGGAHSQLDVDSQTYVVSVGGGGSTFTLSRGATSVRKTCTGDENDCPDGRW